MTMNHRDLTHLPLHLCLPRLDQKRAEVLSVLHGRFHTCIVVLKFIHFVIVHIIYCVFHNKTIQNQTFQLSDDFIKALRVEDMCV